MFTFPSAIAAPPTIQRKVKVAGYIFTSGDLSVLLDWTSGTPCNAATPAAGVQAGWFTYVRNSDTGVLTISAGQGTIDGLASIKAYPGESFGIEFDGTNYHTIGRARGLIYLNTTTLSSSVSTISFSLGFDDPEISAMRFDYYLKLNAAATGANPVVEISKGASYKTTYLAVTQRATGVATNSTLPGIISLSPSTPNAANGLHYGYAEVINQRSAVASAQLVTLRGFYNVSAVNVGFIVSGTESTAAAIDGLRFNANDAGDTWNTGNIVVYGMRN
jgi:hypothetical protein